MNANAQMAALVAENTAMKQRLEGMGFRVAELEALVSTHASTHARTSFRVAELEAHVSELEAVKADMRCMFNILASAQLVNGPQIHAPAEYAAQTVIGQSLLRRACLVGTELALTAAVSQSRHALVFDISQDHHALPQRRVLGLAVRHHRARRQRLAGVGGGGRQLVPVPHHVRCNFHH